MGQDRERLEERQELADQRDREELDDEQYEAELAKLEEQEGAS